MRWIFWYQTSIPSRPELPVELPVREIRLEDPPDQGDGLGVGDDLAEVPVVEVAEHGAAARELARVLGLVEASLGPLQELPLLALGENAVEVGLEIVLGGLEVEDALGGGDRHLGDPEGGADRGPVPEVGGPAEPLHLDHGDEVDLAGGDVREEPLHDGSGRDGLRAHPALVVEDAIPAPALGEFASGACAGRGGTTARPGPGC